MYSSPALKTPTVCENCLKLSALESFLQELLLSDVSENLVEGALICPHCGFKRHIYYLDQKTKIERSKIKIEIDELASLIPVSSETAEKLKILWRKYREVFDACQEKYRRLLEKSVIDYDTRK